MRLELTPGVQSEDSDLDKAGQLKNKYRKLRPAACQASQEHSLGCCNASLFPEQPQASLPQLVHPCKGSTIPVGQAGWRLLAPQGLPLILLQCPAPALPAAVGLGVTPGRAVQPQLLAPAESLGTGVHLHPRRLCKGLERGSAPWVPFTTPPQGSRTSPRPGAHTGAKPTLDEEPQGGGGRAMGALCHTLVQAPVPWLHVDDLQGAVLQQPGPALPWLCHLPIPAPGQVVGHIPKDHAGHDHILARGSRDVARGDDMRWWLYKHRGLGDRSLCPAVERALRLGTSSPHLRQRGRHEPGSLQPCSWLCTHKSPRHPQTLQGSTS